MVRERKTEAVATTLATQEWTDRQPLGPDPGPLLGVFGGLKWTPCCSQDGSLFFIITNIIIADML